VLVDARRLITEYATSLPFRLDFQHFDDEIGDFPGRYAPPAGAVVVAYVDDGAAGVAALRPLEPPDVCEMKRLYVRSGFQGLHIGGTLIAALIDEARARAYRRMRLDTHAPTMASAIALYRRFGFVEIARPANAPADLLFMELALA